MATRAYRPNILQWPFSEDQLANVNDTIEDIYEWLRTLRTLTDAAAAAAAAGGGGSAHDLLSATHTDTTAAAEVDGDLIVGQAGKFARLAKGTDGKALIMVAGAPTWSIDASGLTPAAHNLLSATHGDSSPAAAVNGDLVVAQRDVSGSSDVEKYWLDGLPIDSLSNANDGGSMAYWLDGLPHVGLGSYGTPKWARKANGSTVGMVLTAGVDGPDWQLPASASALPTFAHVYMGADLPMVAAAAAVPIPFSAIVSDASSFWSSGAPTRLTVPAAAAGRYVVLVQTFWTVALVANAWLAIYKNGVMQAESALTAGAAIGTRAPLQSHFIADLAVGDYLEAYVYLEAGGGGISVKGGIRTTFMQMVKV